MAVPHAGHRCIVAHMDFSVVSCSGLWVTSGGSCMLCCTHFVGASTRSSTSLSAFSSLSRRCWATKTLSSMVSSPYCTSEMSSAHSRVGHGLTGEGYADVIRYPVISSLICCCSAGVRCEPSLSRATSLWYSSVAVWALFISSGEWARNLWHVGHVALLWNLGRG